MASIRRRKSNNKLKLQTWEADFIDAFGKRKVKGGFNTKVEAEKFLLETLSSINNGTYKKRNEKMTFAEAARLYIELHAEIRCRKATCDGYKSYLNFHLLPYFGRKLLVDISRNDIEKFIQLKQKEELSARTINHILIFLGAILQKMVDDNVIIINEAKRVKKLKVHSIEMTIFCMKELNAVLNTAKKYYPNLYPCLFTSIMTGIRQGEMAALTWNKINWIKNQIMIDSSYGKGILNRPKNNKTRYVDISKELIKVLKEWKLKCPHSDKNLIFPNSVGNYLDANALYKRQFLPLLEKAGVTKIRWHDLRHQYASLLLTAGNVPIKYIQKQMGHSSIQVTMDNYGHLMEETTQLGINALDNLFKDNLNQENTVKAKLVR